MKKKHWSEKLLATSPRDLMTLFKNKYRVESSRRLGWDYSTPAQYFVTICTKGMVCWFGEVDQKKVVHSMYGAIAHAQWSSLSQYFSNVLLDEFIVMPNHIHGIITLTKRLKNNNATTGDVASNVSTDQSFMATISPKTGSLSTIIRSYKSGVAQRIRAEGRINFEWQPRFHDHIIRHPKSLQTIRNYIHANPEEWEHDKNHPEGLFNWK